MVGKLQEITHKQFNAIRKIIQEQNEINILSELPETVVAKGLVQLPRLGDPEGVG